MVALGLKIAVLDFFLILFCSRFTSLSNSKVLHVLRNWQDLYHMVGNWLQEMLLVLTITMICSTLASP